MKKLAGRLNSMVNEIEEQDVNESVDSKSVRVSNSVVVKYEGDYEKAQRGQVIAKIKTHTEVHGKRPFENAEYITLASAIFADDENSKPLEFVDEFYVTEEPVADARKWIANKMKDIKKL